MQNKSGQFDHLATRRDQLLTEDDFNNNIGQIMSFFENKKVLVIGGAGSIGSSFIYEVLKCNPKTIHIIDPNENGLTNLVRNIRSKEGDRSKVNLISSPLDFGSKISEQFIKENGPYDSIFNFAAIKHVRSEKDIYSTIHMFDTNVIKQSNFLNFLEDNFLTTKYFAVSTDKAANPVSLMGASKRIMELVLQMKHLTKKGSGKITTSTTRFANVAFSNGSLLASFPIRFEKNEPIPAPIDIERYFVSHKESAQICMLAGSLLNEGNILIPKINDKFIIYPIIEVAKNFILEMNRTPVVVNSKEEAYKILEKTKSDEYPILSTKPDTSGEKEYEEFIGINERLMNSGFTNFDVVERSDFNEEELSKFVSDFNSLLDGETSISKEALVEEVKKIVRTFNHIETGETLDNRM
jgi:FlaA1/EpsC-like NDP-sugar epimerase